MSSEMNARGLLEICKALGQVEVTPGFMLFTRDFIRVGRTVDLGFFHRVQVKKVFPSLFVLTFLNKIAGELKCAGLDNEEDILFVLDATLETAKEMGYADYSQSFFPETVENNKL